MEMTDAVYLDYRQWKEDQMTEILKISVKVMLIGIDLYWDINVLNSYNGKSTQYICQRRLNPLPSVIGYAIEKATREDQEVELG